MFKLFQEIRNSGRQRSRLIFLVRDREFLTDKVTKQAVVSPPFFQRLKLFCPHAISLLFAPRSRFVANTQLQRIVPIVNGGLDRSSECAS
jgi:hypothetical protein